MDESEDFKTTITISNRDFEIVGRTRKWNPLPGIDLEEYPLSSKMVTELVCSEADHTVTWATTKDIAIQQMKSALLRWMMSNS